jgi:glycosyltransferase involved in cell wall biosynthesis
MKIGISIISPVFNRLELLKETANSVLNQTHPNWEWVIIDDGSDIVVLEYLNELTFLDNRISVHKREGKIKGAPVCRNLGLSKAKYDCVWFLDSDDLLGVEAIDNRIKIIEKNSDFDFWVFPVGIFSKKPHDTLIFQSLKDDRDDLDRFCFGENVWQTLGVVWHKNFISKIGAFKEDLPSFQDWELSFRSILNSKNYYYAKRSIPDAFYRQTEGESISNKRFNEVNAIYNSKMILDIHQMLSNRNMITENRRIALLNFYVSRLNYWTFIETKKSRKTEILKGIKLAKELKLIESESEAKFVREYLLLYVSKINAFLKKRRNAKESKLKNDSHYLKLIERPAFKKYTYTL